MQLWDHVGLGLIVSWPTGVMFTNQTGGTSCLAPEIEGIFVPLRNYCTEKERVLISPENALWDYFTGPKHRGTGATSGLDDHDCDFIDNILKKADLFPTIRVDRSRQKQSHEAWVYVTISGDEPCDPPIYEGFRPYPRQGILTWQNSD